MKNQQENNHVPICPLMAIIAVMERGLADKDAAIKGLGSIVADKGSAISKLTIDYEAARFQNEQLRRMIHGSKRERFVPVADFHQLMPPG